MLSSSLAPVSSENNRWGMGLGGGLGYSCHFTHSLSLRTGMHVHYYRSTTGMEGINVQSPPMNFPDELEWWGTNTSPNPDGDFILDSKLDKYVAQQSAIYIQLPLLVEFESMFPNAVYLGWYAAGGAKVGYALAGYSDADMQGLTTSATLIYHNIPIEAPKELGFGVTVDESVKAKLDLGLQAVAYLEAGFKQKLTDKYTLYAGIFGEYSLYSITGSAAPTMLEYKMLPVNQSQLEEGASAYQFRYNPSANVTGSNVKTKFPLAFGITVRIGFAFSKRVRQRNDQLFNVRYFQF